MARQNSGLAEMPILTGDQAWEAMKVAVKLNNEVHGQSILLTRAMWAADQALAETAIQLFDNLANAWLADAHDRQMEPEQIAFFEQLFDKQQQMYRQLVRDNLKTDMYQSAWDNGAFNRSSNNAEESSNEQASSLGTTDMAGQSDE